MSWLFTTYDPEKHANTSRELYDSYISPSSSFLCCLKGKVVAITGTTEGSIGYYVACAAVKKNAKIVLLLNRESARAKNAEEAVRSANEDKKGGDAVITTVKSINCNLASFTSVRRAAEEVNLVAGENGGLDVLCNNAGVYNLKDTRTEDGFDVQMQINQLSHFLLTKLIYESLEMAARNRDEARVVTQSSGQILQASMLEKKYFLKCEPGTLGGDSPWEAITNAFGWKSASLVRYQQSKLANSTFAVALHSKLQAKGSKVKSLGCTPGLAATNAQATSIEKGRMSAFSAMRRMKRGQSAADGSLPAVVACFAPDVESGDFYMPEKILRGPPINTFRSGAPTIDGLEGTCNIENQKIMWESCEKAVGVDFSF